MYTDLAYMQKIRRELHACPGLGFQLSETVAIVKRELTALGIPFTEKYCESSVVACLGPKQASRTLALRADMDALPITEDTGLPYASRNPGIMHACGHDLHTAFLLGAAAALKAREESLKVRVKLIFQPAEEVAGASGAYCMVENGVLEDVDEILGAHTSLGSPAGTIAINKRCMAASCRNFRIILQGRAAHGAAYQKGVDAIAMAATFYTELQMFRARAVAPGEPLVITVGTVEGGKAPNIVCDRVTLTGTIRTITPGLEESVVKQMEQLLKSVAANFGGSYVFDCPEGLPVCINDPAVHEKLLSSAAKVIGEKNILERPLGMGAEDFAFYLQRRPGARFMFGAKQENCGAAHNAKFNPDDSCLTVPADVLVQYVLDAEA